MAADRLITFEDGSQPYHTCKLSRLPDGSIMGYCGEGYEDIVDWLREGGVKENAPPGKKDKDDPQDWQLMRLTPTGILVYTNSPHPDPIKHRVFAIGNGADVAMYAMKYHKKTPADAVRAAIKICWRTCGGQVDVMTLNNKKKRGC